MSRSVKNLGRFVKPNQFDKGLGALLPEAYKKFYKEWRLTQPTAVHYVPEQGKWKRDEVTGEVHPIQNVPIPIIYPKEHDEHLWGGEGIVQGFQRRDKYQRRVPHFWVPMLKRCVVYSEILDKNVSVVVTDRTISLITSNFGFDHYILKTPACDLKSLLALSMKRKLLQELENGCPSYSDRPEKQEEILEHYKQYLSSYTSEEIEWYGYSFGQACRKMEAKVEAEKQTVPLKQVYRAQLIEKLKIAGIKEAADNELAKDSTSWLQKINPFSKKHET